MLYYDKSEKKSYETKKMFNIHPKVNLDSFILSYLILAVIWELVQELISNIIYLTFYR